MACPITRKRLKEIAHLGRAGWTEKSEASYRLKMSGPNNPAWKGGVTYKRSKGNYLGPKYIRCPKEPEKDGGLCTGAHRPNKPARLGANPQGENTPVKNFHPTVKPISLMRYLCRLITPPKGKVLDPFMGSGTTGCAALLEGFSFVGIEREKDYFQIAKRRVEFSRRQKKAS